MKCSCWPGCQTEVEIDLSGMTPDQIESTRKNHEYHDLRDAMVKDEVLSLIEKRWSRWCAMAHFNGKDVSKFCVDAMRYELSLIMDTKKEADRIADHYAEKGFDRETIYRTHFDLLSVDLDNKSKDQMYRWG